MRGIWVSDLHLGLHTDDMDRTEEILEVITYAFNRAVKIKANFVVIGGDIFDSNTPSERLIAQFISLLNILNGVERVFVMVGNHDIIAGHKRRSCLSFIQKLKAYPNLELIDDIKSMMVCENVYFTFLPFLAKAHLKPAYKSVQQYVNVKADSISRKMPKNANHFVFSHLMPPDCIPGTEEFMLKKVDVGLPKAFINCKKNRNIPIIINGHVHTRQSKGNIHVVGSQFFIGFGEKETEKYFIQLDISERTVNGSGSMRYIKSKCRKLCELNLELKKPTKVKKALKKILKGRVVTDSIVKVNLTLQPAAVGFDAQGLNEALSELSYFTKPIHPRILKKRIKRNKKQVVKLGPHLAVKEWMKTHKPKNAKQLLKLSDSYMGDM